MEQAEHVGEGDEEANRSLSTIMSGTLGKGETQGESWQEVRDRGKEQVGSVWAWLSVWMPQGIALGSTYLHLIRLLKNNKNIFVFLPQRVRETEFQVLKKQTNKTTLNMLWLN